MSWQVLRVYPQHELRVSRQLDLRETTWYLPTVERKSRWSDRWVTRAAPLFAGYVFVRGGDRVEILRMPGVRGYLEFAGVAAQMSDAEIEQLRVIAAMPDVCEVDRLPAGARVRIAQGPLRGVVGTLDRRDGSLIVTYEMLGRHLKIQMRAEALEAA